MVPSSTPLRDPAPMLAQTLERWGGSGDLWVFAYASLIWRPEFEFDEQRPARVAGWHRALKMWSRINRGTPQCPGLVFALLSGGSCQGMAFRVSAQRVPEAMERLWQREMPSGVYDPQWIRTQTPRGDVQALTFTLSRRSPSYTGPLSDAQYLEILGSSCGRFGTTLDYARQTHEALLRQGIRDRQLDRLLSLLPSKP